MQTNNSPTLILKLSTKKLHKPIRCQLTYTHRNGMASPMARHTRNTNHCLQSPFTFQQQRKEIPRDEIDTKYANTAYSFPVSAELEVMGCQLASRYPALLIRTPRRPYYSSLMTSHFTIDTLMSPLTVRILAATSSSSEVEREQMVILSAPALANPSVIRS